MSAWAKVGAKCVCVANGFASACKINEPEIGATYTIRTVEKYGDKIGVRLVEVSNPATLWFDRHGRSKNDWEPCFLIEWFRPLITKTQEQDAELFRSLLTDLPVGEDA